MSDISIKIILTEHRSRDVFFVASKPFANESGIVNIEAYEKITKKSSGLSVRFSS